MEWNFQKSKRFAHIIITNSKQREGKEMTEPNYAIVRQNKIKSIRAMNGRYRHNARVDIPPNADPEKLKLDRQLVGNMSDNYATIFHDTIKKLDYYNKNEQERRELALAGRNSCWKRFTQRKLIRSLLAEEGLCN